MKVIIDSIVENGELNMDTDAWVTNRIGIVKEGSSRALKIKTSSSKERDVVLELAPNLKSQGDPWARST